MYLGEIVKKVIIDAMNQNLLFQETLANTVILGKIETSYISDIEMCV